MATGQVPKFLPQTQTELKYKNLLSEPTKYFTVYVI